MFIKKLGYTQNWSTTLTAGIIKNNFKEAMERFVGRDNTFSFMSSVKKKHQHTGKSFYILY